MLPRENRLRSGREFRLVFAEGRSWGHPLLVLHAAPRAAGRRIGITAGRKVGNAVTRNRVRRRLREAVRVRLEEWKAGFDAVLIARAEGAEADFEALAGAVDELARRARLPREPGAPPDTLYELPATGRPGRPAPAPGPKVGGDKRKTDE